MFWPTTHLEWPKYGWMTTGNSIKFTLLPLPSSKYKICIQDSCTTTVMAAGTRSSRRESDILGTFPRGELSGRGFSANHSNGGVVFVCFPVLTFDGNLCLARYLYKYIFWTGTLTTLRWRCHSISCWAVGRSSIEPQESVLTKVTRFHARYWNHFLLMVFRLP